MGKDERRAGKKKKKKGIAQTTGIFLLEDCLRVDSAAFGVVARPLSTRGTTVNFDLATVRVPDPFSQPGRKMTFPGDSLKTRLSDVLEDRKERLRFPSFVRAWLIPSEALKGTSLRPIINRAVGSTLAFDLVEC